MTDPAADTSPDKQTAASPKGIMPPYLVLRDFLPEETVASLIDFALAHEADFAPTRIGRHPNGEIDPAIRVSTGTRELGPLRPVLKAKMLALVPDLVAKLGVTSVESPKLELELVAHNDGAFFTRHIDTKFASDRYAIRVLSGVYYFHAEPKAFTGGALRLYAIGGGGDARYIHIEPTHNTLLVFPSWAPHEVMPIVCPSKRFADSRFAVNCWVYRTKAAEKFEPNRRTPG